MKKIFILMLAVLAMVTVCATGAMADGTPQIQVGSVDSAVPGATIEVPVRLVNNPGINTFTLTVVYEPTQLSLTNVTKNSDLAGNFTYAMNNVVWQDTQDTTFAGTAFTLTFSVLDNAPLGNASVSITYDQGNICNFDEEDVNFTVVPGSVTVEAAPHDHSWGEGEITTPATCEDEGVRTYTCSICNATRTEEIAALGHSFTGEVTASTPATCTEAATETRKCVRYDTCGETGTRTVGQPAGHDYTVTTTPATCTEDGEEVSVCKNCAVGTEGHEVTRVLKSEGHQYDDGEVIKEATCTEEGEKLLTCTVCNEGDEGHTKTETIAKLPHTKPEDESQIEHVDATAEKDGYDKYICAVCGEEVTEVIKYVKPAAGGNGAGTSKQAPKTGDETNIGLYILTLTLCAAGLCAVTVRKRKEN